MKRAKTRILPDTNMWVITGGAGFIGSALLWQLNQKNSTDVLVVDRLETSEKWKNLRSLQFADYLEADDFLSRLEKNQFQKLEGIVHMGACSSTTETNASFLIQNNFEYTKRLALYALRKKKRFIYASSAATYGDGSLGYTTDIATTLRLKPLNMYGYSKQLFDIWAHRHGFLKSMVGVKFFNVFGPNEYHKGDMRSVVSKAFDQIQKTGLMTLFKSYRTDYGHGEQVRDFIYVKDAVRVLYQFMTHSSYKGLINLGTGQARSWNDLGHAIFRALGKEPRIQFVEMPETLREKYQYHTQADMSWMQKTKGLAPMQPLEESVQDYVQNYLIKEDPYLS